MTHLPKNHLYVVLIVTLIMTCAGCGGSRVPDPTATDVKQEVLRLSKDVVRNALLPEFAQAETGISAGSLQQFGYPEFSFPEWQAVRGQSDVLERIVSKIETATKDLGMELENIRIETKDESLRKIGCLAQLRLANGNTIEIRYSAQYTEDGKLYIQVELIG